MTETYSLVQTELGAAIDRLALEEASVAAPNVGKADCARIARELFGIIVSGLPIEDAMAFRAALLAKNFPTQIAADRDIPRLPESRFFQRLTVSDHSFAITDVMRREEHFAADEVLLVAAGFLQRIKNFRELEVRTRMSTGATYVEVNANNSVKDIAEFRVEFFLRRKPYRCALIASSATPFFLNGQLLQTHKPAAPKSLLVVLQKIFPAQKINHAIQHADDEIEYPSLRAFENEIRWRFYMLKQRAADR